MPADLPATFDALKAVLEPYAEYMQVTNTPQMYLLESHKLDKANKPYYFGAVRMGKNYVSLYLMPVYTHPELLSTLSPGLKKRMQGKSCFNFKNPDAALFEEVAALSQQGFERYQQTGWI